MSDQLQETLKLVNDWLRFAEAKNAIIFGVSASLTVTYSRLFFEDAPSHHIIVSCYFGNGAVCALLAAFVALGSFLPELNIFESENESACLDDNLIYFGTLRHYSPDILLTRYAPPDGPDLPRSRLDHDYAQQIITNSKITFSKYRFFECAAWLIFSVVLTPVLSWPLRAYAERRKRIKLADTMKKRLGILDSSAT